jgi:hypothetical protein
MAVKFFLDREGELFAREESGYEFLSAPIFDGLFDLNKLEFPLLMGDTDPGAAMHDMTVKVFQIGFPRERAFGPGMEIREAERNDEENIHKISCTI